MSMFHSHPARTTAPSGDSGNPSTASTPGDVDAAVAAAAAVADQFASTSAAERSGLLRAMALALELARDSLIAVADLESGLGTARLNGEIDRTAFQLRGFADVLDHGDAYSLVDEEAIAGVPPAGRPRLTRVRIPIGPVAVFAASNFPFAFSVLGGDTASALAAGSPVVIKGHPGHAELSRRTVALAQSVVAQQGLPAGVLQFVQGEGFDVGIRLVQAPAIAAVAFTGSFRGGTSLAKLAAERPRPIPFYGELGSVNPLVVLPDALGSGGAALAQLLAGSICLGAGQFCTSPGIIVLGKDAASDAFAVELALAMRASQLHAMLSPGIRSAFEHGISFWREHVAVSVLVDNAECSGSEPRAFLAEVQAKDFIADHRLREEVFGAAALIVRTDSVGEAVAVLHAVGGALTVTLWGVETGHVEPEADIIRLVRAAMQVAGRVLFAGVPTGVAVTVAQHHGGPFPASTAPFTTSVGYAAMDRFLRPLALQDAPHWLLNRAGRPC